MSQEGVSSTTLNESGCLFVNTRTWLTVLYLPPFCHVLHYIVDLFLQKEWYSLVAPFIFAKKDGGNTIVTKNIRPRICLWRIKESCHWSLACGPWKEWRYILPQDNTLYWRMCKVSTAFSTFTAQIWAVTKSIVLSRNAKQSLRRDAILRPLIKDIWFACLYCVYIEEREADQKPLIWEVGAMP